MNPQNTMNVIKQIHINNDDSATIEKLSTLQDEAWAYGEGDYNATRRYRRLLNKLSGGLGGKTHMVTSNGWNSNGDANLVIGD